MNEVTPQSIKEEVAVPTQFPGLRISESLRRRLTEVTRSERLVEKVLTQVLGQAVLDKHPDVTWLNEENREEVAAEWIARSTGLGDTGSSGFGFGLSPRSDREYIVFGSSRLSRDIGLAYGQMIRQRFGTEVEGTFLSISPTPVAMDSARDSMSFTEFSLDGPIHNQGTITKIMMARPVWGDPRIFTQIKDKITDQDLAWVGLYAAINETPWSIRSGYSSDRIKYGMGGKRAVLNLLQMSSFLMHDRHFFTDPETMADNMVSGGVINGKQRFYLLKAISDYTAATAYHYRSHLDNQTLVPQSTLLKYIPDYITNPDQEVHEIRSNRKHVLQTYYQTRDQVLGPLGFSTHNALRYKASSAQEQIDYVLHSNSSSSQLALRIAAGIWLTRDLNVVQALYQAQEVPSWLSGLGVVKFRPILTGQIGDHQQLSHQRLLTQVLEDNHRFWGDEAYIKSTTAKSAKSLGYTVAQPSVN